ncbi:LptF/LptG family permease [Spirochaetota bacterium]
MHFYAFKNFLIPLIGALVLFIGILIIIDILEQLEYFLIFEVPFTVLVQYYFYKIPLVFLWIFPVAVLFSILFSLGMLNKNNELIGVFNAGITLFRLIAPIIIFIFAICFALFIFNDQLIYKPNYKYKMLHNKIRFIKTRKKSDIRKQLTVFGKNNKIYFIDTYDPNTKEMGNVHILFLKNDNSIESIISCSSLNYILEDDLWTASNVYKREWAQKEIERVTHTESETYDLGEKPYHFENEEKHVEDMSIQECYRYAKKIENIGGNYKARYTDYYHKMALPFISLIIVFFGAPLSIYSRRSVLAISFALAIVVAFMYYILIYTGISLGHNNILSPFIAGWFGNILFVSIGIYMFRKMQT